MRARAAVAVLSLLAACAHGRTPGVAAGEPQVGIASFYGREFEGRPTASGARYDGRAMTCAHRSFPFGALLEVTDLETGRTVRVTVNDRGPFAEGRIVDLSREAARRLGILERGLARVRVERIR